MHDGMYLTWEEVQRLMLPPNATMLIPPPPEQLEVPALSAGAAPPRPDWLDDAFAAHPGQVQESPGHAPDPADIEQARADAERAKYGPGWVRLIANAITVNAVLEYAYSLPRKEEKKPRPIPLKPEAE